MFTRLLCCHLVCVGGETKWQCKSYADKKRPKNGKFAPPNDTWKDYLKTWSRWISQSFKGHCPWTTQRGLQHPIWTPSFNGQCADTHWVLTNDHKTQSFIKNGGQQNCLDKALLTFYLAIFLTIFPKFVLIWLKWKIVSI